MTRLRKSMIFLIVHLAFVFNLERLDYIGENIVNVQSFVYGLVLLSILSSILVPVFKNHSPYFSLFVWVGSYFALKTLVFNIQPIYGGIYTYLTITEMAMLTVTVFLAKDLNRSLSDFEEVVEKVTLPKYGQRVVPMKDAAEEIKSEFIRSRRHDRPISVMVVDMDLKNLQHAELERIIKDVQKAMVQRFMIASMAQLITKEARRTDMILEQDTNGAFVLLCPETSGEGTAILAERIQTIAQERLGVQVNIGYSSFPEEAVSFEELLQKAEFNILKAENLPVYEPPAPKPLDKKSTNESMI